MPVRTNTLRAQEFHDDRGDGVDETECRETEADLLLRETRSLRSEVYELRKAIVVLTDILRSDKADTRLEMLVADLQQLKASRNGG